jgi:signal transduction histidine kinase
MQSHLSSLLRSTTVRFIALTFAAQLVVAIVVLAFMSIASQRALLNEHQALVAELRDDLLVEYANGGPSTLITSIADRIELQEGVGIVAILLIKADGSPVIGNIDAWPATVGPNERWKVMSLYRSHSAMPESIGLMATTLSDGSRLLVGRVIENGMQLRRANEAALFVALLVALPLSLAVALFLSKLINSRISDIARTAQAVRSGALSERVRITGSDDAFDRLGLGINAMLERIEDLVSELRMITDGLAHDLRSPVTRLKSTIERAAAETSDPRALAALESISSEAQTLLGMLTTALQISRAEAGIGRDRFQPMELAALLEDLVEIYGPLAEERGFQLAWDAPEGLVIPLHRELMSQALGNLIENALNYASGGNIIRLSASPSGGEIVLIVADNGPGIVEEQRARALQRFGRLDPARHLSGSGLGLSLVEAVVRLHGGVIALEDAAPGLAVIMKLPMDDAGPGIQVVTPARPG